MLELNSTSPRASPIRLPISSVMVRANSSALFVQDRRRFGDDRRPLGIGLVPPGLEASLRRPRAWPRIRLSVSSSNFFSGLPVKGIDALVGHGLVLFKCCRAEAATTPSLLVAKPR